MGFHIERVRVTIGVIGIIFESRLNVTLDIAALCLKSGNSCILRPGSESFASSIAIGLAILEGVEDAALPSGVVQLVPDPDRATVGMMLEGLDGHIDPIIPRGGKSLVERVVREARIAILGYLEGVRHVYVHEGG